MVANPPFAVEGFLQTLSDADKKQYQLIQATGESSDTNTIQCFFLERIHHLMAPGGLVGVIVPSSILSNTDAVHTRTRELLLQFFDLMSIAELGSGTFGKTGTNTVVLFLRRKAQKPEASEHYYDRVADFFEGDDESKEYQDDYLIKAYCEHIEVSYEEYIKLFAPTSIAQIDELLQCDIFKDYKQAFSQSTEMKNLKKSNVFRRKTATEQSAELEQRFIAYLHAIEKDKLYYFILAHEQENRVLIVNAPSKKKEQDQFLGYKWSGAKGHEGIKYNSGETVNDIITPLFDPNDLDNSTKINTAIKRNFIGETTISLPEYCNYAELTDMLDFSRTDFNKAIGLTPKQNFGIETKWKLVKLGEVIVLYDDRRKPVSEGERTKSLFEKSFWVKLFALKPSFFLKTRFLPQSRRSPTIQRHIITIFSKPCQVNRRGLVSKLDGLGKPTPTLRYRSQWIDKSTAPWGNSLLFKTGSKGIYPYYGATGIIDYVNEFIFDEDLVLIGEDGAKWGPNEKTAFLATGKYWVNNHAHVFKPIEEKLDYTYIIELLNFLNLDTFITGYAPRKLNQANLKEIKISLPPLEVQQRIANECEAVDQETNEALQTITAAEQTIEEELQAVVSAGYEMKKLEDIAEKLMAGGDVPKNNFSQIKTDKFNIPIFANGVKDKGLYGYTDIIKVTKPSITISARGTIGYTEVRDEIFYPIVRLIVLTPNVDLGRVDI